MSHTLAITKSITTQRERILLVEWACPYSAWSNSTNRMRSLCVVTLSFSLSLQCDSALIPFHRDKSSYIPTCNERRCRCQRTPDVLADVDLLRRGGTVAGRLLSASFERCTFTLHYWGKEVSQESDQFSDLVCTTDETDQGTHYIASGTKIIELQRC